MFRLYMLRDSLSRQVVTRFEPFDSLHNLAGQIGIAADAKQLHEAALIKDDNRRMALDVKRRISKGLQIADNRQLDLPIGQSPPQCVALFVVGSVDTAKNAAASSPCSRCRASDSCCSVASQAGLS